MELAGLVSGERQNVERYGDREDQAKAMVEMEQGKKERKI